MVKVSRPGDGETEGTVLIVDDESFIREMVVFILETRGIRSISASTGEEALEIYNEHRNEIDAVLLDLTMPGMSGEETFRRLRAIDPDANIVLSSGYAEIEIHAKFPALRSVSGFIQKPYQSDALLSALGCYLKQNT